MVAITLSLAINLKEDDIQAKQGISNSPKTELQHINNEALTPNNIPSPWGESETINIPDMCLQQKFYAVLLPYNVNQLVEPNVWDGEVHSVSIFNTMEFLEIDSKNMFTSLLCIANYIRSNKIKKEKANNIPELKNFGEVIWSFISSIYESEWNILSLNKNNKSFRGKVSYKFTPQCYNSKPLELDYEVTLY